MESYKDLIHVSERPPKFKLHDRVRLDKTRGIFEKGYWPTFTREVFEIYEIIPSVPVTYRVRDLSGNVISGIFYNQELSRVRL